MSTSPPILRYFRSGHLPPDLAAVAIRFEALADWIATNLPGSAEQSTALRKLLESKDAAVRAALPSEPEVDPKRPDTWPKTGLFSPHDGG